MTADLPTHSSTEAVGEVRRREQLAAIEHERWAEWQLWLHQQCYPGPPSAPGSLLIPAELVRRWERQIGTPYEALSEAEKDSDRAQVDRYWPLLIAEFEKLRSDLSAMTSDRDWLRGEFEKASASAAGVRKICREWIERYQRNLATAGEYAEAGRLVLHELDGMIWCDTYRCPGHERDDPARSAAPCYPSALTTTKED